MDVMDIQPPKRRPVMPQRPVRPVVQSQPRPKISLESVRQVRQSAQQHDQVAEQSWPDYSSEVPKRPEPVPQFEAREPQTYAPVQPRQTQPVSAYEPQPEVLQEPVALQTAPMAEPATEPKRIKKQKQHKPHKRKHRLRTALVSIFVVLVLGAVVTAGGLWYVRNQQPEYIAAKFVSDLQANNPGAAYTLVSSTFKATTPETVLNGLFSQGYAKLQGPYVVSDQILPSKANPSSATYVYKITTAANGTEYVRVIVQKNAKWQVNGFSASNKILTAQVAN